MAKREIGIAFFGSSFIIPRRTKGAIDQVAELTGIFAGESSIYSKLGFCKRKFVHWLKSQIRGGACIILATVDGQPAGYALAYIDKGYIKRKNFEIITIYVPPEFRNSGVGAKLADYLVDMIEVNECDYSQISICAAFQNDAELIQIATERLFKRRGFYQIGVVLGKKGSSWD